MRTRPPRAFFLQPLPGGACVITRRDRISVTASRMGGLGDDELMLRLRAGDQSAFRLLYARHSTAALGMARSLIRESAQDAVQDAFTSVWCRPERYRPGIGSVRAWILTIVRRRALDLARSEARRGATHNDQMIEAAIAPGCLEDDAITRDDSALLCGALDRLPSPQREVIVLAYFGGLTHKQIATRPSASGGDGQGSDAVGN